MSGICGGFWFNDKLEKKVVKEMAELLKHRGQDDLSFYFNDRIVREVSGINRVVYDITSKPPATIEWE